VSLYHILGVSLVVIGTLMLNMNYSWWKDRKKTNFITFFLFLILPRIIVSVCSMVDKKVLEMYSKGFSFDSSMVIFCIDKFFFGIWLIPFFLYERKIKANIESKFGLNSFLAVLFYTLTEFSYFFLLSMEAVSYVLSIRRLDSVIASFVGGKIFKEKNFEKNVLASIVIFVGANLVVLNDLIEKLL